MGKTAYLVENIICNDKETAQSIYSQKPVRFKTHYPLFEVKQVGTSVFRLYMEMPKTLSIKKAKQLLAAKVIYENDFTNDEFTTFIERAKYEHH